MSFISRVLRSFSGDDRSEAQSLRRRQIEAGAGGRRWDGAPMIAAAQQSALAARAPAKARATALALNTPIAANICETWVAHLVGSGWQAQSQHPDQDTRRALNREFEAISSAVLTVACRSLVREGEAILRLSLGAEGFHVTPLPADQLDAALTRDLGNGRKIIAGVELDVLDRVVAYHLLPSAPGNPFGMVGAPVRIEARDVLHVFDRLVPGQVRGLPWMTPVLLKLFDLDATSDAMLMALKVQSLMTGFIRDPSGQGAGFGGEEEAGAAPNVSLEPGAMRILPGDAEVTFSQPGQGLAQAAEFVKAQLREIAAGTGLTYEMVSRDLSGANYSSARVGLLEFRRRAEMLQGNLIEAQLLRPLWRRWIEAKALAGEIAADTGTMADHLSVKFVPPGWPWIDPESEVNADIKAIDAGLKSRSEVVAGRGRDIEELDDELGADKFTPKTNQKAGA